MNKVIVSGELKYAVNLSKLVHGNYIFFIIYLMGKRTEILWRIKTHYNYYKETLPITQAQGLAATDALVTQLCSLQYIPKDPTPRTKFPYDNVAYVKGKVKVRGGGQRTKWTEILLPYPLTVE